MAGSLANGGIGSLGASRAAPDPRVARVLAVPDGEHLHVRFVSGAQRTLRYIGVDVPSCGARAMTRANRALVAERDRVRVAFAPRRYDGEGELLAYVSTVPGGRLVNELLWAAAAPQQGAWARC